jgi:hypothetical protein
MVRRRNTDRLCGHIVRTGSGAPTRNFAIQAVVGWSCIGHSLLTRRGRVVGVVVRWCASVAPAATTVAVVASFRTAGIRTAVRVIVRSTDAASVRLILDCILVALWKVDTRLVAGRRWTPTTTIHRSQWGCIRMRRDNRCFRLRNKHGGFRTKDSGHEASKSHHYWLKCSSPCRTLEGVSVMVNNRTNKHRRLCVFFLVTYSTSFFHVPKILVPIHSFFLVLAPRFKSAQHTLQIHKVHYVGIAPTNRRRTAATRGFHGQRRLRRWP